jgi:hypothetical protein
LELYPGGQYHALIRTRSGRTASAANRPFSSASPCTLR